MPRALNVVDYGPIPSRSCGTCSLCCTVMGVEELQKPRDTKCVHLTTLGRCNCYSTRPASCAGFNCLWLQGLLPKELQPERCRAVAMTNSLGDMVVFQIHPKDRGAHLRGHLAHTIEKLASGGIPVIVVCGEERHLYGAREQDIQKISAVE